MFGFSKSFTTSHTYSIFIQSQSENGYKYACVNKASWIYTTGYSFHFSNAVMAILDWMCCAKSSSYENPTLNVCGIFRVRDEKAEKNKIK